MKVRKNFVNSNREHIVDTIDNMTSTQHAFIRKLSSVECFKLMGVPDKYIKRMCNPDKELRAMGYSEVEINNLLCDKDGKRVVVDESQLRSQAGNSIVVNVITRVLKQLFRPDGIFYNHLEDYNDRYQGNI